MDIRPLTPAYAVSPQIAAADLPAIVEAGFTCVICNRPDAEVSPDLHAEAIKAAAEAAGLDFVIAPVTHPTIGPETINRQMQVLAEAKGPVLAYCASGTRSSVLWALGQAGHMTADEILGATAAAGYDLSALRPALTASAPR